MAEDYDKSHRLLFSHPELVEELIRHFVGGTWTEGLDFETLEKVSERDVSRELIRREKDLLWRLRWLAPGPDREPGDWLYVFLHLEFQSTPERFMALRMLTYKVLLYEDLVRRKALTRQGLLPPVLSVVLYNGGEAWREASSLDALIQRFPGSESSAPPEGFALPSYRLIDERSYPAARLEEASGPLAALFRLEQSRDLGELRSGVQRLLQALPGPEDRSLRETFATWLTTVVIPMVEPGAKIPELYDLTEVDSMLQQTVREWRDSWIEEGRQEGRAEGVRKGEAAVLLRQMERKFGPLPERIRSRVESATARQLLIWADRILIAEKVEQVFHG